MNSSDDGWSSVQASGHLECGGWRWNPDTGFTCDCGATFRGFPYQTPGGGGVDRWSSAAPTGLPRNGCKSEVEDTIRPLFLTSDASDDSPSAAS